MSEDKAARRVGSVVADKYRLRRVIGRGGMGAVYEAVHAFTGKQCAVKVLDPAASHIQGYATRFLREARAAAQIGHPSICDVLDAGQDPSDGSLYLVLELLEGEDLGAAIRRGDLTTSEIIEIGAQVLEALAAAHGSGIVHRDIKPENVFLTRDEQGDLRVKLLDFGVAKEMKRGKELHDTTQGMLVGTPYYMAPEQISGRPIDGRADVWSTGAMLFHALSEDPPFDAVNYNKLLLKIVSEPAPSLRTYRPDLPDWLINTIDRALRTEPGERWTASQMATWLRARGEVAMSLDWEEVYEDATLRTPSPFGTDLDPAPPKVDIGILTPPAKGKAADVTAPQRPAAIAIESQPTVAAPSIRRSALGTEAQPTPQTWERPSRPGRRSGKAFVVGVLVGALVAVMAGVGVAWWLITRGEEPPRPFAAPARFAPDTGVDEDAAVPEGGVRAERARGPRSTVDVD